MTNLDRAVRRFNDRKLTTNNAVESAKSSFLEGLYEAKDQAADNVFTDKLNEIAGSYQDFDSEPQAPSRIVSQEGPIAEHADGTYSVFTAEGKTISGLNELDARSFGAYDQENARALESGAPDDFLGTKVNAIAQTTIDLGTQAASAFTTDPENLKSIKDFGENLKTNVPVNRKEQVAAHTAFTTIAKNQGNFAAIGNALFNDLGTFISQGVDSVPYMVAFTIGGPIAQTSILTSLALGKGNQAVEEFAEVNGRRANQEEVTRIKWWSAVAAVAEKYGDMAALKAVPGRLAWMTQVAKTVEKEIPPSILSLAILRPATALAGEALSGGITSASEQLAAKGEITDPNAIVFDSFAEAAGTPGGVATLATANTIYNAGKAVNTAAKIVNEVDGRNRGEITVDNAKKALASDEPVLFKQTSEGILRANRLTEIDTLLAKTENPAELSKLGEEKAALVTELDQEASVEQTAAYKAELQNFVTEGEKKLAENKVKEEEAAQAKVLKKKEGTLIDPTELDTEIATISAATDFDVAVKGIEELKKRSLNASQKEKVQAIEDSTYELNDEDFQGAIDDIGASDTTADQAAYILQELGKRRLTKEQLVIAEKAKVDQLTKENAAPAPIDEGLGSIGDGLNADEQKLKVLQEQLESENADESSKEYVATLIKFKSLEKELQAPTQSEKTASDVHKESIAGQTDRWTGLITFLDSIIKATGNTELSAHGKTASITKLEQDLDRHAGNIQRKAETFRDALTKAGKSGTVTVHAKVDVSGTRETSYTIVDPATLSKTEQEFTTRISAKSAGFVALVEKEAEFSKEIVKVATDYKDTSFSKDADQLAADAITTVERIDALRKVKFDTKLNEITDDNIDASTDPTKTENTNVQPTSKQEEQNKTPAKVADSEGKTPAPTATPEVTESPVKGSEGDGSGSVSAAKEIKSEKPAPKVDPATAALEEDFEPSAADLEEVGKKSIAKKRLTPPSKRIGRDIPIGEISKQTLQTVFPELFKDGALIDLSTANEQLLSEVAKILELGTEATVGEITAALGKLPNTKNFLETTAPEKLLPLRKDGDKGLVGNSPETLLGVLGKKITDFINFFQPKGIHSIATDIFNRALAGKTELLEDSLVDLGISEKSAGILAKDYVAFSKRYSKILAKEDPEFAFIRNPLSLLFVDGVLPPQIVFGMMVGVNNWASQNTTTSPFRGSYAEKEFLYGGNKELNANETAEMAKLGFGYNKASNDIGENILSLLKISAKDIVDKDGNPIDNSIFLSKLVPALGVAAIESAQGENTGIEEGSALFEVSVHNWKFKKAYEEGRHFNNFKTIALKPDEWKTGKDSNGRRITIKFKYELRGGNKIPGEFKQIKINALTKDGKEVAREFSKDRRGALLELAKKLKVDPPSSELLSSPLDRAVDSIKNSFGTIPRKTTQVLEGMQKVKWSTGISVKAVTALNTEKHRHVLESLIDVEAHDDKDRPDIIESRKSSNRSKTVALDELLDAQEEGLLDEVYFAYKLQNQNRIMMQGKINPQNSKVVRALLKPFRPVEYTSKNLKFFKLAVAAQMGFPVDKVNPEAAIAAFNEMVKDPAVLAAVYALQNIEKDGQLDILADSLEVIKGSIKYGGDMSIIDALTGLSQYLVLKSDKRRTTKFKEVEFNSTFTSDVSFEIDGISNGFAINLLQFPQFKTEEELINHLRQTGTHIGKHTEELEHNPNITDIYLELGELVANTFSTVAHAAAYAIDHRNEFNESTYKKHSAALDLLFPDFHDGNLRTLVKYPFMIFMYGGGITAISIGVAKNVADAVSEQLNSIQRQLTSKKAREAYLRSPEVVAILNAMDALGFIPKGTDSTKTNVANLQNAIFSKEGSRLIELQDSVAVGNIVETISPRFDLALNSMLGEAVNARDAAIQAGEILHAVFLSHLKLATDKITKKTGRTSFTKSEIDNLVKSPELLKFLPQYSGPLDSEAIVDLSKRSSTAGEGSSADTVDFNFTDKKTGKGRTSTSDPQQNGFTSPGVAALIRMIINMDASLLTETLGQNPNFLALHDALMGSPEQLAIAAEFYNEKYIEYGQSVNVLRSITEQMNAVIEATEEIDKANGNTALIDEIDKWVRENGFQNRGVRDPKKKIGLEKRIGIIQAEETQNTDAKEGVLAELFKDQVKAFQLYMGIPKDDSDINLAQSQSESIQERIADRKDKIVPEKVEDPLQDIKDDIEEDAKQSLSDLPRSGEVTDGNLSGDLGKGRVRKLFNKMHEFSQNYYSSPLEGQEHTAVLDRVMTILSKGMDATTRIRLTVEHIDGITQGRFVPFRNQMRISLSRKPPVPRNAQSPQEVYTHEMVHAMTSAALEAEPLLRRKVERIYNEVKAELGKQGGYRVFLYDIKGKPSAEDIAIAKQQYNYIFNPTLENEKNKLHEFIAYGTTNKALVNFLSNRNLKKPVRDKGLINRLLGILDEIRMAFQRLLNKGVKRNTSEELLAIVENLTAIQAKHESKYVQLRNKGFKYLDKADKKIQEFVERKSLELLKPKIKSRFKAVIQTGALAGNILFSENAVFASIRETIHDMLGKTLRDTALEVGRGALGPRLIERVLHTKVSVSKARTTAERLSTEIFNKSFKSVDPGKLGSISVQTREAMTNIMFRIDLSSLLTAGMEISHRDILDLIGNSDAHADKRRKLKRDLLRGLNLQTTDTAIKYADELGEYIADGNTEMKNGHMNVHSIAHDHLENIDAKSIALLDAYTTLVALENSDTTDRGLVGTLMQTEFNKDSKENGIIDLLDTHRDYKQRSFEGLFNKNPAQMVKGFIVERVDNLTTSTTGTVADGEHLRKLGYTETYKLSDIPGIRKGKQAHTLLYVSRTIPEVADASGAMSTTNKRNMGTSLTEIFSNDPTFHDSDGNPDLLAIRSEIRGIIKSEAEAAKSLARDKKFNLRPIRDENYKITDYRVLMNHATKKELIRPDMEVQNVLAHMQSTLVDRKRTIAANKKTVEVLVDEQGDLFESHKNLFIDFLDPDSRYIDRFRKLPRETREYMKSFAVDGKFMIRKDVIDKVFGYKVRDIGQAKIFDNNAFPAQKKVAKWMHYMMREIVGYGKDRIVIAMPQVVIGNMASNISQLTMRKIPIEYTWHKIEEGFHEYEKYRSNIDERAKLQHRVNTKGLTKSSEEQDKIDRLTISIENSKIHRMNVAGLDALVVEDVNEARIDGFFNRIRRSIKVSRFEKYVDKVPTLVSDVAANLFMTKSTTPYQLSKHTVQLTDFLGRYVMIEHGMQVKKQTFNVAMHESLDAFVLFDELLTPALEALDAIGLTSFLSYYLRNQRSSRQIVAASPTSVAISAAVQHATGLPTLGNINSSIFGGDMSPNLWQFDDLFDEATNPTGFDLLTEYLNTPFD